MVKAVEQFLIFAQQPENQVPFMHTFAFMVPCYKPVAESPDYWSDPILARVKENQELTFKAMMISHHYGTVTKGGRINPFGYLLERGIIEAMFHRMYVDKLPVEEAVKEAQKKLEERVKEQKALLGYK